MKRITLQTEELQDVESIVDKYREIGTKLDFIQSQLKTLDDQKAQLLEVLENIREEETSFLASLEKSYGEGKIDPLTLEYVTKQ